ncbi:peptidase domain-containing ABC transporter [Pseudanabaena sp. PCC 6802]|uniref:peptidase domain-containing ABC transporter n=1 Tax=Pseudanabaena sp. PCC 6802 TaxID=118173 RepID=UPI00034A99AD|nr:peptidase domain-containing ABC transporter [Pseudanabaena sp. PCC 6802]
MKYQNVLQHSEEDCGAACLATISKYYGRNFSISHIREAVGTGQLGTTLLGLIQGSETLGFNSRGVKADPQILDRMKELPLPAIIHWQGNHYVVFYGQRGQNYVIADPAVGILYLSRKELLAGWTHGVTLLLEPDPIRFTEKEDDAIASFWRFLNPVWSYRSILGEALLINLILGLLSLALPFLIQILTDDVLVRGDRQLLVGIVAAVGVMQLMSSSLQLVQFNLIAHFAQRLELGLILEFGRKILRLPLSYYESHRSGEIVSRLRDIEEINQLVSQVVVSLPSQLFVAVISLGLMLYYSGKLVAVALAIAAFMTISTIVLMPVLRHRIRRLLVIEAENQGVLVETFKGALTVKTTSAAPQFWEEFQSRFGRLANVTFKTIQIGIINRTFSIFVAGVGNVILLWFGSHLVISQELSIGQLLAFNTMNANFLVFLNVVVRFVSDFIRANTAVQRLAEVIDSTPETQGRAPKPWVAIPSDADIACTRLNYHYAGRVNLLTDFSLTIPGGKITALIGRSGCGKSSLAKLIASLYDLQSGNIRIGIYNLQDIALDCLRQQVVLIPQEPHFWSRSILENFRLGAPHATFEQIVKACQIAEADDFISNLPDKYQTVLGEFGANISGGQRQRLAIARAIVSDPPILILDESTAGLDPASEAQVLDRLLLHRRGKTTVLISHRPRVINRADWLVVLDRGELVLEGTLHDLHSKPGNHLDFLRP